MDFYTNFYIFCIILKILIAFYLLIYLKVLLFKKFIILKFMCRYKLFIVKNRNNFIKTYLLLLITNSIIINLFNKLSY